VPKPFLKKRNRAILSLASFGVLVMLVLMAIDSPLSPTTSVSAIWGDSNYDYCYVYVIDMHCEDGIDYFLNPGNDTIDIVPVVISTIQVFCLLDLWLPQPSYLNYTQFDEWTRMKGEIISPSGVHHNLGDASIIDYPYYEAYSSYYIQYQFSDVDYQINAIGDYGLVLEWSFLSDG
jgi:hypothetical protein